MTLTLLHSTFPVVTLGAVALGLLLLVALVLAGVVAGVVWLWRRR